MPSNGNNRNRSPFVPAAPVGVRPLAYIEMTSSGSFGAARLFLHQFDLTQRRTSIYALLRQHDKNTCPRPQGHPLDLAHPSRASLHSLAIALHTLPEFDLGRTRSCMIADRPTCQLSRLRSRWALVPPGMTPASRNVMPVIHERTQPGSAIEKPFDLKPKRAWPGSEYHTLTRLVLGRLFYSNHAFWQTQQPGPT